MTRTTLRAVLAGVCLLLFAALPARAGTANGGVAHASRANPLASLTAGIYTGATDNVYPAYASASRGHRTLLAKIARRPLAFWFGSWIADRDAQATARQYIENVTGGNPRVMAQMTVFRLDPWEQTACHTVPSAAAQRSYRRWIDGFAAGIGSARVALILQPDLPFALCAPSRVPLALVNYAARRFSALPHTSVYIDGGAHWFPMRPSQAVWMLEQAGIRYARGFALNTTEYDATGAELEYGARLISGLEAGGYGLKHMVINTSENGAPFLNGQYRGNVVNPRVCVRRGDRVCATLGIPPTTQVSAPQWGLSGHDRSLAARYADAYLWIGRPWLDNGSYPFDLGRALGLAGSSPF